MLVRVDGVSFSKLTKSLSKPFDTRISDAMIRTSHDLMVKFNPCLIHTVNNRHEKLSSIIASFTAVRFNHHLTLLHIPNHLLHSACFDGKTFDIPHDDIIRSLVDRSSGNNSITAIAQSHLNTHNLSLQKQIELLSKNNILSQYNPKFIHGTFFKKELYTKDTAINKHSNTNVPVTRTRIRTGSFKLDSNAHQFVFDKYWNTYPKDNLI
jgi:hypothetical protein